MEPPHKGSERPSPPKTHSFIAALLLSLAIDRRLLWWFSLTGDVLLPLPGRNPSAERRFEPLARFGCFKGFCWALNGRFIVNLLVPILFEVVCLNDLML